MYAYGTTSRERLATCHPTLVRLFNEIIKHRDVTILCGHRGQTDQNIAYANGASTKQWPNSKHNSMPSIAVDAAPWPLTAEHWNDREHWVAWGNYVVGFAAGMGIRVRSGIDWNMNHSGSDERFFDGPHFELVNP